VADFQPGDRVIFMPPDPSIAVYVGAAIVKEVRPDAIAIWIGPNLVANALPEFLTRPSLEEWLTA
jgi:hypothetical protein